jgi:hypothetical protein
MNNVRASFNKLVATLTDSGVPVIAEPSKPWQDPCYRIEWLDAEVPRGVYLATRNVRVHIRQSDSTANADARMDRLIRALGLGNQASLTPSNLYDYTSSPTSPPLIGTFQIERSPRGVTVLPPPIENPQIRHLVLNLVVVYRL